MIYLDHAATTRMYPEAIEEMMPYFLDCFGNPSSAYGPGMKAKKAVNQAKRKIAETLGAQMQEIHFTSGGTESDNLALLGVARGMVAKGKHIITTQIEHKAVLQACEELEKEGFEITYLPVNKKGFLELPDLEAAIRPDTILISVHFANNEIGSIEPIAGAAEIAKRQGILFHTDAVAAYGKLPIPVKELGIDLLSASGHKFHGPKGVGFIYVREGVRLAPIIMGGSQDGGIRGGTENVPGIVGMAAAAQLSCCRMEENRRKKLELKKQFVKLLNEKIPGCSFNQPFENCLEGVVSVSFPGFDAEEILIQLDCEGICASGGSACATGDRKPSHVLLALGLDGKTAKGTIRFTLGEENTVNELEQVVDSLDRIVNSSQRRTR